MSSVMVLCLAEPPPYRDLGVARRRYLTMQGPCGHANKLCGQTIRKITLKMKKTHAIVSGRNFVELELKVPDESDQDASNLEVSKLRDSQFPVKIVCSSRELTCSPMQRCLPAPKG
jgi:hypothetical protein